MGTGDWLLRMLTKSSRCVVAVLGKHPAAVLLLTHSCGACHVWQVWKGTQKASELKLQDVPVALCALLLDSQGPRVPTVTVAAGPHVYMFQNMRPFYKFTLPAAGTHAAEEAVW